MPYTSVAHRSHIWVHSLHLRIEMIQISMAIILLLRTEDNKKSSFYPYRPSQYIYLAHGHNRVQHCPVGRVSMCAQADDNIRLRCTAWSAPRIRNIAPQHKSYRCALGFDLSLLFVFCFALVLELLKKCIKIPISPVSQSRIIPKKLNAVRCHSLLTNIQTHS